MEDSSSSSEAFGFRVPLNTRKLKASDPFQFQFPFPVSPIQSPNFFVFSSFPPQFRNLQPLLFFFSVSISVWEPRNSLISESIATFRIVSRSISCPLLAIAVTRFLISLFSLSYFDHESIWLFDLFHHLVLRMTSCCWEIFVCFDLFDHPMVCSILVVLI